MDGPRFERLTSISRVAEHARITRRSALRRIGGGGLAATLAATTGAGWSAAGAAAHEEDEAAGHDPSTATGDAAQPSEVVIPTATRETLPVTAPETAGRVRLLTDYDRSLWLDRGDRWVGLTGEIFNVQAFGAVADGVTDDWPAFHAALEAMTSDLNLDSTSPFGRTLYVPPGTYRLAQSLVIDGEISLTGSGGGGPYNDAVLQFDPGIIGVIVEGRTPNITGARRGNGTIIERLRIRAAAEEIAAATDGEGAPEEPATSLPAHGILLRARATVRDCTVAAFNGDGIHVELPPGATTQDGPGNWEVHNCLVAECTGHGLYVSGTGAGSGLCSLLRAEGNGQWGIYEDSSLGNTYLGCRAGANARGPFRSGGGTNYSLFLGCTSTDGQPRSSFGNATIVVGGDHAAGYQGGNSWTATGSRVFLLAQSPGTGETPLPTVPTLVLQAAEGQQQPHLRINDRTGTRQVELDVAGRLFVGPLAPTDVAGPGAAEPVLVQLSHPESGQAGIRWVLLGDFTRWVAQARAFRDAAGPDAPNAQAGFGGGRLTFQTPNATGEAIDTLTLRAGRVGIGTNAPAPAAILDLASLSQGFLPPRMSTQQRDAIPVPPEGLTIYNVTTKRLNFHDGTAWREVATQTVGG